MFDEKERKEQLTIMYKAYKSEYFPDKIISQEKLMIEQLESRILYLEDLDNHKHHGDKWLIELIEQAKKEAVKEFSSRIEIHCSSGERTKESINKLLKEYTQCPTCKGKGSAYDDEVGIETCPDCRGKGNIK